VWRIVWCRFFPSIFDLFIALHNLSCFCRRYWAFSFGVCCPPFLSSNSLFHENPPSYPLPQFHGASQTFELLPDNLLRSILQRVLSPSATSSYSRLPPPPTFLQTTSYPEAQILRPEISFPTEKQASFSRLLARSKRLVPPLSFPFPIPVLPHFLLSDSRLFFRFNSPMRWLILRPALSRHLVDISFFPSRPWPLFSSSPSILERLYSLMD